MQRLPSPLRYWLPHGARHFVHQSWLTVWTRLILRSEGTLLSAIRLDAECLVHLRQLAIGTPELPK